MKKIYLLCVLLAPTVVNSQQLQLYKVLKTASENEIANCKIRGFNLLAFDSNFKVLLDNKLKTFGGLKSKDFDSDTCFLEKDLVDEVVTAKYAQVGSKFIGHNLKMYTAYDARNNKLLAVLIDEENKNYILGDRDQFLISSLRKAFEQDEKGSKIDFSSTYTYSDLNANYLSNKKSEENSKLLAEKLESDKKIYSEASSNIRKQNTKDLILSDLSYSGMLKDGEQKDSKINIYVKMDKAINVPLSKKEILQNLLLVSVLAKTGLKNPYSFKPRSAIVEQEQTQLKIILEYTAKNSYGADVVGYEHRDMFLWRDGKYHTKPTP